MANLHFSSEEMKRYFDEPEYRRKNIRKRRQRVLTLTLGALFVFSLIGGGGWWYFNYILSGLPPLEKLENPEPELATRVFSADGVVLDQYFIKNRNYISLDSLPPTLARGLVATEDKQFFEHWGVHLGRIVRALVKNIIRLDPTGEGASTLTQQLARNLYWERDRSFFDAITRKFREVFTSVQIEQRFTKNEILELYLNVTYYGRGAYGIESAANRFFGKKASQLTIPESALLIAILKGPGYYDPLRHPERAKGRRALVLNEMARDGIITEEEAQRAKEEPLNIASGTEEDFRTGIAPHFVEMVRRQMIEKGEQYGFDIYRDGLTVYTTLDSRIQRAAIQAAEEHLASFQKDFNSAWNWNRYPNILQDNIEKSIRETDAFKKAPTQQKKDSIAIRLRSSSSFIDSVKRIASTIEMGVVVLNPHNGYITALIGSSNFRESKYGLNRVTQIRRQPGSAFKTFVYTVAIDNGYSPAYEILNQPIVIPQMDGTQWAPENIDGSFGGKFTIREGLRKSVNLIAVRAIIDIAPPSEVVNYSNRMGIASKLFPYPSLALGTSEVTPMELTTAYGVLANDGILVEPLSILRIEDKNGMVIEKNTPARRDVLSKETAFLMTDMLEDVINSGTGARVRQYFQFPAAGKTGTTNDYGDAWFIGYTPQYVAGVWLGFDDNRIKFTSSDGQGGRAAAPIWGRMMQIVYADNTIPIEYPIFLKPAGIDVVTLCTSSKKKATTFCKETTQEFYNSKYPIPDCDLHRAEQQTETRKLPGRIEW